MPGADVFARVASFSAAAAAASDGATNWPAAFSNAAVGMFQAAPSGAPVQTDETGKESPTIEGSGEVGMVHRGTLVVALTVRSLSRKG